MRKSATFAPFVLFALLVLAASGVRAEGTTVVGDDGIYKQTWFLESFLDIGEDLAEAQAAGKRLAILWEQKGCPYCKDTHTVNFAKKPIQTYVRENFVVVQLNMWGDREVTDLDGEVLSEKDMAKKWGVVFTPTIHYLVEEHEVEADTSAKDNLAAVMPGYFRPFHFLRMFEFVKGRIYERLHFQKYIAEKSEEFRREGKSFDM